MRFLQSFNGKEYLVTVDNSDVENPPAALGEIVIPFGLEADEEYLKAKCFVFKKEYENPGLTALTKESKEIKL